MPLTFLRTFKSPFFLLFPTQNLYAIIGQSGGIINKLIVQRYHYSGFGINLGRLVVRNLLKMINSYYVCVVQGRRGGFPLSDKKERDHRLLFLVSIQSHRSQLNICPFS